MKQKFSLRWLCATILLLCATQTWAYDFSATNDDGVIIYYDVVSSEDLTCEVTYGSDMYDTYSVSSITIPETVRYSGKIYTVVGIGSSAFRSSSTSSASLIEVIIPTTITYIGNYAFYNSATLTSLTIPNSVTTIGNYSFEHCTSLSEITIPSSVTSMGERAFYNCSSIKNVTLEDGEKTLAMTTSSSYTPFTNCSAIKTLYLGRNLSYNDTYAPFRGNTSLTSLVIGNKVTSIGRCEFRDCTSLEDVTIEDSEKKLTMTTSVSYRTFDNCSAIKTLYLGRNLSYTDTYAPFRSKESITSLVIGNKVTSIGTYDFNGCTGLEDVTIEDGEETLSMSISSFSVKTLYLGRNLSYSSTSAPFKEKTTLSSLTIGSKVTSIGQYAFYGCTGLKGELIIPSNVTSIGDRAFYNCSKLEDVTIEEGEDALTMTTSSSATPFTDCSTLKTLYLGRNLSYTTSSYAPFRGNTSLTSLVIGNKVMSLGEYEFYGCTNLTDLILEDSEVTLTMTTSSSATPFTNCPIEILYKGRNVSYDSSYSPFRDNTSLTTLTIGEKVTSIEQYEFMDCTNLIGELVIPNNVTEIGNHAFESCNGIETLTIADGEETLAMTTNYLGTPFTNCPVKILYKGRNVSYDSSYSPFRGNTSLTTLTIGEKVTSIEQYEFYGCTNLIGELVIPNNVTEIDNYAFYNCNGIETLTIEDSEETLTMTTGYSTTPFTNCPIETLYKGRNVSYNGSYSPFKGNTILTSLTIGNKVTYIGEYEFEDCSALEGVFVPNNVTSIESYAFYNCSGLNAITIGDGVTTIGSGAFYNCSSLEQINIPDNVVSIGNSTFSNCSAMKEATIGRGVNEIGRSAFNYCTALQQVNYNAINCSVPSSSSIFNQCDNLSVFNIGDNVETIPSSLCYNCTAIKEMVIPNNVITIGSLAFYNCESLENLQLGNGLTEIGSSAFSNCTSLVEVTIPTNVTEIGSSAFYNCSGLREVVFNATACSSARGAFYSCSNLQKATIGDNATIIPSLLFNNCTGLTELVIGKDVVEIGSGAFSTCVALAQVDYNATDCTSASVSPFMLCEDLSIVNIGNNVRTIPEYLFSNCPAIKEIIIPNSVTTIGQYAFNSCSALASVVVGNRVTEIGNYAFYDCISLTSLTLGSRVEELGRFAFAYCENLEEIYSYNSEPPVCKSSVFDDVNKKTCILYVPIGSKGDYSTADVWEEFYNIVEVDLPDGIESVMTSSDDAEVVGYYTIDGKAVDAPQHGVNIVKFSDGSTKKLLVK